MKLRHANKDGHTLELTLPSSISRKLEAAGLVGRDFEAVLTEDGVLFRLLDVPVVPAWLNGNGEAS